MTVSRETPLERLLLQIAKKLGLGSESLTAWQSLSDLTSSAAALILLSIINIARRPVVVVSDSASLSEKIYSAAFNIWPERSVLFPEIATDDSQIPGFGLEGHRYRSEAVNLLRKNIPGLIFTSRKAANETAIDEAVDGGSSFLLKNKESADHQFLINSLVAWDYEQTSHTEAPQTFSVRGGILDVFLPYSANPVRLEFFGNIIESIRIFNPRSQRTIKNIDYVEILPPPSGNGTNNNTVSIINFIAGRADLISVVEELGSITMNFNENSTNSRSLACKKVEFDDQGRASNKMSIDSIKNLSPTAALFLFSENIRKKSVVEKWIGKNFTIINNSLPQSFYSKELNLCCLSRSELNTQTPVLRSRWTVDFIAEVSQRQFSSLEGLDWGDPLVHQDFGIGLYRGLDTILTHDKINQECIKIEFADNANIYIPVDKFNRVHKLIITGDKEPTLSALNSPAWGRQKQKVKASAKIIVQDLVNLYSSRNSLRGFKYNKNNDFMLALESSFPYLETPGQTAAIKAVLSDMESDSPVDRLVCGDVGFGKTEVALRAAVKAIISGRKVLFLTPTTILADQHFISTQGRLEPLGINIELLSRFKTKKQQKEILEKMITGQSDLVIGTHRLLSQDVNFPGLGLLIIDEEHRFGVKHKEKLRRLRSTVDVLTLTATPIPRTLQHSLLGIRDISRINTPPKTRRPIKTFVKYFNWDNIQIVINNELMRNGQVYFLHNDILSIPFIFKKLCGLFPKHVIGVAYGKMNSKDLEDTVLSFFDGKVDILLCTTIVESGLDVANANTIIINNAQNFGLSQLYQIRGRVGRGHHQAYCHLLLPHGKTINKKAHRRLKAIEQFTSLGSGYDVSLKDLEIRGAGNLFGYKQSGNIAAVGYEMYCKLLQEAVDESTGQPERPQAPKISMPIDAMLDRDYVSLVQDRLYFYQQLSEAGSIEAANVIENELRDRFGKLPISAKNLLYITRLRVRLTGTSIITISVVGADVKILLSDFSPFPSVNTLVTVVEERMELNNFKYQFTTTKNGFLILVNASKFSLVFKILDLFVKLFSK